MSKEITIPDGYVIDHQEGNKIILKKKQYGPSSWEQCLTTLFWRDINSLCYINNKSAVCFNITRTTLSDNHNIIPVEYSKPILALMQLLLCYKTYVKDWKPNWKNNKQTKFSIDVVNDELYKENFLGSNHLLAFPCAEMRDEFFDNFKDLLKEAMLFI
jgi:hypothetical protein